MLPQAIKNFIEKFSRLPSIGPRLATRLALYIASLPPEELQKMQDAMMRLNEINRCPFCFSLKAKNKEYCEICLDKKRDRTTVAIIEKEIDLAAIEDSRVYNGLYFILGEVPHNGILPEEQKLRLKKLKLEITEKKRIVREIVIALPQNSFGDFMAETIRQGLQGIVAKITRLGRGLPTGGTVEFADEETLKGALEKRG